MVTQVEMPITDSHMHLDPTGRREAAVREFLRAGGTHIFVVNKPYDEVRDIDDLRREFGTSLRLTSAAVEAGAVAHAVVGPHPVHYVRLLDRMERDDAHRLMLEAIDIAADLCGEGDAVAIGEVGLPHFPVETWVREDALEQLAHAMERAAEVGCAVVVHSETTDAIYGELADLARRAGLPRHRLVKHYSPPATEVADALGMFLSILAREVNVAVALEGGRNFMLETDYIDDPRRPGAVLGPRTVPRVTLRMLETGNLDDETAHLIHVENPSRVFGVEIAL